MIDKVLDGESVASATQKINDDIERGNITEGVLSSLGPELTRVSNAARKTGYSSGSYAIPFSQMPTARQVCLLFVGGQSNAERGEAVPNSEGSAAFFKDVETLTYGNVSANIDDSSKWTWSPFEANMKYNLGRNFSSQRLRTGTYSIAKAWQEAINSGQALPRVRIVHLSYSGRGFDYPQSAPGSGGGFNPAFPPDALTPSGDNYWRLLGRLQKFAIDSITSNGLVCRHLGLIWNQWERDSLNDEIVAAYGGFLRGLLRHAFDLPAGEEVPFMHWEPRAPSLASTPELTQRGDALRATFEAIRDERAKSFSFDVARTAEYDESQTNFGVYSDHLHYVPTINKTFTAPVFMSLITGDDSVVDRDGVPYFDGELNNGVIIYR